MNDASMGRAELVNLLCGMIGDRNGIHLRDALPSLSLRGMDFQDVGELRAYLERYRIDVRGQLKVGGLNAAGIHWSAVRDEDGEALLSEPSRTSARAYCIAKDGGGMCQDSATVTVPVPLCDYHRWEVAVSLAPELADRAPVRPTGEELVDRARPVEVPAVGSHERVVYFIAVGGQVKIGYTANLGYRLTSLSLSRSRVLLTVEGGRRTELALHRHFAALHTGSGEWFRLESPLSDYIARKAAELEAVAAPSPIALPS